MPDKGLGALGLHQGGFLNPDSVLLSPSEPHTPHCPHWQRDTPDVHVVIIHHVWLHFTEFHFKPSSHHGLLHLLFLQTEA